MEPCEIKEALPEIVQSILDNIEKTPKSRIVEQPPLPSNEIAVECLETLFAIVYPGYYTEDLCQANLPYYIGQRADRLVHMLTREIGKALQSGGTCCEKPHALDREASQKATEFLRRIPKVRSLLEEDVQAAYDGDPAAKSLGEIITSYPGLVAITVYRLAHELIQLDVPLIPRMWTEWAHSRTGIDIHPGATIGRSFFIDHGTGVVIGETTLIGDNVKMYQGVTLGALSFPKDERGNIIRGRKRHPTIENGVTLYANATILGGDTVIGEGSVIGGNVWITESVPPHTKVVIETPQQKFITRSQKGGA